MNLGECKEWNGGKDKDGYGLTKVNGKSKRVHRHNWEQTKGPIPPGMFVLHRCDNTSCYRISHLFLGTPKDNVQDMVSKKRDRSVGERNPRAKLTWADIEEIRRLAPTTTRKALSDRYGIVPSAISAIVLGKSWRESR